MKVCEEIIYTYYKKQLSVDKGKVRVKFQWSEDGGEVLIDSFDGILFFGTEVSNIHQGTIESRCENLLAKFLSVCSKDPSQLPYLDTVRGVLNTAEKHCKARIVELNLTKNED